jgi:hypothetical protein
MPGARCTRSRACRVDSTRVSHHGRTGNHPAFPHANGFNGCFVLSLVTGLVCHHRLADTSATLDASVGASGPHDFAVRKLARSSVAHSRPSHPNLTFVTIAIRPLCGPGWRQ